MANRREVAILVGAGILAAGAGIAFGPRLTSLAQPADTSALRSARFADLSGNQRTLDEWQGRILVINFWATWCPPCREEIPALVLAREKLLPSGVEFIGIAIDQASKVSKFKDQVPISYPLLISDAAGLDLMRQLGNPSGGLPYTIVLDRKGALIHRNLGGVTQQKIEDLVLPMLRS